MAGKSDPLFTIDFGQILAKLHLGAIQAVPPNSKYGYPINTGVDNSVVVDPKDMPEGYVFNINAKDRKYEFGLFQEIEYQPPIPEDLDTELKKLNADKDKILEEIKKLNATDTSNAEKKQAEVEKIDKKIEERQKALEKENEAAKAALKKTKDELRKTCFEGIKQYFTVFAGKTNSADIKEADLAIFQLSNKIKDNKDKNIVKDFKIQAISEDELKAQNEENMKILEKNSKTKLKANYGYRVGFTVDTEAM